MFFRFYQITSQIRYYFKSQILSALRAEIQFLEESQIKRPSKEPFASAVFHTASAHYISPGFTSAVFPKRQQTECSLIPLHFVALHSFTHCLHLLAGSQAEAQGSKARFNASTVRPVASCICFAVALRFVSCLFPREASLYGKASCTPPVSLILQNHR